MLCLFVLSVALFAALPQPVAGGRFPEDLDAGGSYHAQLRLRGASASSHYTLRKTHSAPELTREALPFPCDSKAPSESDLSGYALSLGYGRLSSPYVEFPFGYSVALEASELGCLGDEIWRNHKVFPWGSGKEAKHGPAGADLSPAMTTNRIVERWEWQNFAEVMNESVNELARARSSVGMLEGDIGGQVELTESNF